MNDLVIIQTTQGLAKYVLESAESQEEVRKTRRRRRRRRRRKGK